MMELPSVSPQEGSWSHQLAYSWMRKLMVLGGLRDAVVARDMRPYWPLCCSWELPAAPRLATGGTVEDIPDQDDLRSFPPSSRLPYFLWSAQATLRMQRRSEWCSARPGERGKIRCFAWVFLSDIQVLLLESSWQLRFCPLPLVVWRRLWFS